MTTHPHGSTPGAVRGRPRVLPSTIAHETRILTSAGFSVLEIAEHFSVDRSTMYRQRNFAAEFMQSLKDGRDAYLSLERDLVALQRLEVAEHTREAARALAEILREVSNPIAAFSDPVLPSAALWSDEQDPDQQSTPRGAHSTESDLTGPFDESDGPGAPLPLNDPLADW